MRINRKSILALGFVLTVSAGFVSAHALPPVRAGQRAGLEPSAVRTSACDRSFKPPATGTVLAARKNCDAALAACLNGGGNSDTCWNSYWRCISN